MMAFLLSLIEAAIFWIGLTLATEFLPQFAGQIAFVLVMWLVCFSFHARRKRTSKSDLDVLNYKLDRIMGVVRDIQENPLVELKVDPNREPPRRRRRG